MQDQDLLSYIVNLTKQTDRIGLIFELLISINKMTNALESRFLDFQLDDRTHLMLQQAWSLQKSSSEPLDPLHRSIDLHDIPGFVHFFSSSPTPHAEYHWNGSKFGISGYLVPGEYHASSMLIVYHLPGQCINQKTIHFFLTIFYNLQHNIHAKDQDPLTGLFNRRSFDETIATILDHAIYGQQPNRSPADGACLAIFDIDFFKRINDNHGHSIGDEVLILFARLMEKMFRSHDRLYRFGGEEFIAILTEVDLDKAAFALERFRTALEAYSFPQVGTVTVSIGATMLNRKDFPPVLIEKADQSLYFAKEHGRNQVCFHEHLVTRGFLHTTDHTSDNIELWN
ncbi:MAG: GGDEF domain-containing protein [Magnetococcus sp. YQC-5]